jgi:hypothetical protein
MQSNLTCGKYVFVPLPDFIPKSAFQNQIEIMDLGDAGIGMLISS